MHIFCTDAYTKLELFSDAQIQGEFFTDKQSNMALQCDSQELISRDPEG